MRNIHKTVDKYSASIVVKRTRLIRVFSGLYKILFEKKMLKLRRFSRQQSIYRLPEKLGNFESLIHRENCIHENENV